MLQCAAVCCSVLQCVAVCCSVLFFSTYTFIYTCMLFFSLSSRSLFQVSFYSHTNIRIIFSDCLPRTCERARSLLLSLVLTRSSLLARLFFLERAYTHSHTHITTHAATHCNTLQHSTAHCNTLQHTATHCNTPQHAQHRSLKQPNLKCTFSKA